MIERSEKIEALSAALVAFQGTMPPVPKGSVNPFFGSKYADLADIREAAKPHLLEVGLAVTQWPSADGLITVVHHTSGQWMSATMRVFMDKETSQAQGSALTYARRYAYTAALGIVTEPDDDGNSAGHEGQTQHASSPQISEEQKADMDRLVELIKSVPDDAEREKLASNIRGRFGPPLEMNHAQIKGAIAVAETYHHPEVKTYGEDPEGENDPVQLIPTDGERF